MTPELPVFVSTDEIKFFVGSPNTHRQVLTLYNPYKFAVRYQVFSNTRDKYNVVSPKGTIGSESRMDVFITHMRINQFSECDGNDKLLIEMRDNVTKKLVGKKHVSVKLFHGEIDSIQLGEESSTFMERIEQSRPREPMRPDETEANFKKYGLIFSAILVLVLFLPTEVRIVEESFLPSYLHVPVAYKMAACFLLGFIFMGLVRPFQPPLPRP